jgi:hypothetical protein
VTLALQPSHPELAAWRAATFGARKQRGIKRLRSKLRERRALSQFIYKTPLNAMMVSVANVAKCRPFQRRDVRPINTSQLYSNTTA